MRIGRGKPLPAAQQRVYRSIRKSTLIGDVPADLALIVDLDGEHVTVVEATIRIVHAAARSLSSVLRNTRGAGETIGPAENVSPSSVGQLISTKPQPLA